MKISPISDSGMTVGAVTPSEVPQSMAQKMRSLRMNTNATPGRVEEQMPPVAQPLPDAQKLTISDNSKDQTSATTEETQPLSPQFAALAKQRRSLQAKEREIADREKALEARSASPADAVPIARLKSDPLGVLLESGVTYEQLTEAVLANQSGYNPEIQALKQKLADLESGLDKKLTDRDTQTEQQVLAEMRKEATSLASQGEDFALVRETGSISDVMRLIERTYRETSEVLDVREALKLVEDELFEESLKIARINKVQSQLVPQAPALPPQQQRQMRTLTNRDTASVPISRKQRAIMAFRGTLKQ